MRNQAGWNSVLNGVLMTTKSNPGPPRTPMGGLKLFLGAATTRAPAASKPSSNYTVPVAWITEPAIDSRFDKDSVDYSEY